MSDEDDFSLLDSEDDGPQKRCNQCKLVYGKPQKHNESALRCASCDYPFGETYDAIRALAFSLQDPVKDERWNVHSTVVCYTWLRLIRDGLDLAIEPAAVDDEFGTSPEWFSHEISETGWGDIMHPGHIWKMDEKPLFSGSWNQWALEEGICPNQPFLVEMKPPHWHKTSYEYEEWDVEYDWQIVMKLPRSPKQAARAWELWKKDCEKSYVAMYQHREREAYKRTHDLKAMYVQYDSWGMNPYADYGSSSSGYIVALCSKHGGGWLLQGRSPSSEEERAKLYRKRGEQHDDPEPSHDRAWDDLLAQVQKHYPHLDPVAIRKLDTRRRW